MRGLIIILALMLSIPLALAEEGELRRLNGTCDETGNANISMLHYGGAIKTTDINITAEHVRTGSVTGVEGVWSQQRGDDVLYITGEIERAYFRTTNSPLKKKGPYDIHFVFFQRKSDLLPTDVKVGITCPGLPCDSDVDCDYDAQCREGVCVGLNCDEDEVIEFHECYSKCNDFNPCTIDFYDNGTCRYERKEGECCRTDADCETGRACFTDKCVNNKCVEEEVICKAAEDKCVYAFCEETKGCVYKTDESCLAGENEKREYLIKIGEPTVQKKHFWTRVMEAVRSFFNSLF